MLVDNGSSLSVLPKVVLVKLDYEGIMLKRSDVMVKAFNGSKRMVHGEVNLPIRVGSEVFDSTFYVMDICPAYSRLLRRPWIHGACVGTSTLHQNLKYPTKGKIVTVCVEEEYVVSHLNGFKYVEMDGNFVETPSHTFEFVPQIVPAAKPNSSIPKVSRVPPIMASLKDTKVVLKDAKVVVRIGVVPFGVISLTFLVNRTSLVWV